MADYTDDDVARLAEMMQYRSERAWDWHDHARHLLERGVTLPPPPPDPAVVAIRSAGVRTMSATAVVLLVALLALWLVLFGRGSHRG